MNQAEILPEIRALLQTLHAHPEASGQEAATAAAVRAFLAHHGLFPAKELAGHGLLYRLDGKQAGPARLFRADLDAVMTSGGLRHACGHDGHTAMLAGALLCLAEGNWPGTVYAFFQPAEENGQGMQAALPHLPKVERAFAFHNVPGWPLGTLLLRQGTAAVASTGWRISLAGQSSHASEPHRGQNPIPVLTELVALAQRAPGRLPFGHSALVVPIYLQAGEAAFGTSPGQGGLGLTLRADDQADLEAMLAFLNAESTARAQGFSVSLELVEPFPATVNAPEAVEMVLRQGFPTVDLPRPFPWSEDFGHATRVWPGALIGLGAGPDCPPLHSPEYDFPEALLPTGVRLWCALAT